MAKKLVWLGKLTYNFFSHEIQDSFDLMRTALREQFEPSCKKEFYKVEWENRTKRAEEDWADFGDDICVHS